MINLHHYRTRSAQQQLQHQHQQTNECGLQGFSSCAELGLSSELGLFFAAILKLAAAVSAEAVPMGRTTKHPALLLVSLKKRRALSARGNAAAICFYFMRSALKNAVNVSEAGLQTAQTGTCRLGEDLTAPKRQTARQPLPQQQQQLQQQQQQNKRQPTLKNKFCRGRKFTASSHFLLLLRGQGNWLLCCCCF